MTYYDKTSKKKLGRFLQSVRISKNLSQRDVAEKLNLTSPQFISNVERGLSLFPNDQMKKIVKVYGLGEEKMKEIFIREMHSSLTRILK